MGLFIRQDEKRTELSERIASEMRERQKQRVEQLHDLDDQSKDAHLLKNTNETNTTGIYIIIGIILVVALGIYLARA